MSRGFMEPIGCSDCGDCVPIEEANAEIADQLLKSAPEDDRDARIATLESQLAALRQAEAKGDE